MQLIHIAVFCIAAFLYSALLPPRWRGWVLLVGSVIAIYWLQPPLNIRQWGFILPTITIGLAVWGWWVTKNVLVPADQPLTSPPDAAGDKRRLPFPRRVAAGESRSSELRRVFAGEDRLTLVLITLTILVLATTRYLPAELRLIPRPPELLFIVLGLLFAAGVGIVMARLLGSRILTFAMLLIVALFVVTKAEALAAAVAGLLRAGQGQDVSLAAAVDLQWLGFSYVAFRLIHTLRDRQTGKLPDLTLREYLTYLIFFPAYTAGPIDRAERFAPEYRALPELRGMDSARWFEGGRRIVIGLFKKFVIADSLALLALDAAKAEQALSAGALWLLLYAYAFRLFFDFSGYSDIAIGIGRLFGITLPENFDRPYTRQNLARFWQSWHMTLSNWARFYIFSPLSRTLLKLERKPPQPMVILISHLATMIVIGLWHGITATFLVWGVWHAVGLFIHKQWSDRTRTWYLGLRDKPRTKQAVTLISIIVTFHFVVLGWVWFALPELGLAAKAFARLFGVGW